LGRLVFLKKGLFYESEHEIRNPFLIFTQNNDHKSITLTDITGRESISWDLPIEHPLLKIFGLLELGYYAFLYPNLQDSIGIFLDLVKGDTALIIGIQYLYQFYKLVLLNGMSDILYLKPFFGTLKSCLSLIQNIKDLFILIFNINKDIILNDINKYIETFGKLKDVKLNEYNKYYQEQEENLFTDENDIQILDIVIKTDLLTNSRIRDKIKILIMNSWILLLSKTKTEEYPSSDVINMDYFNQFIQENSLNTFIFNKYKEFLTKNGLLFKLDDIINEFNDIKKVSQEVSHKQIINTCKIRNIDRCIILYDSPEKDHFIHLFNDQNLFRDIPVFVDLFGELNDLFSLYLYIEKIDYFLFKTEFDDDKEEKRDLQEIESNEKLQAHINLIGYYTDYLSKNKNNKPILNIGLYLYFILKNK